MAKNAIPNLKTRKTFEASDAGKGLVRATGVKDLFRKLGMKAGILKLFGKVDWEKDYDYKAARKRG